MTVALERAAVQSVQRLAGCPDDVKQQKRSLGQTGAAGAWLNAEDSVCWA